MTKILNLVIGIVGGWLLLAPFVLRYPTISSGIISVAAGLILIALVFFNIRQVTNQKLTLSILAISLLLVCWVVVSDILGFASGISEGISGFIAAILAIIIIPFQISVQKVSSFNRNGGELATFSQVRVKGDNILVKAILLGSMPETIYIYPEELCKLVAVMDINVLLSLPRLLFLGWKRNRSTNQ